METSDFDKFNRTAETILKAARAMAEALLPVVEALSNSIMALHTTFRERYDAVGAPYGPTDEDMYRFLRERAALFVAYREAGATLAHRQWVDEMMRRKAAGASISEIVSTPLPDLTSWTLDPENLFRIR